MAGVGSLPGCRQCGAANREVDDRWQQGCDEHSGDHQPLGERRAPGGFKQAAPFHLGDASDRDGGVKGFDGKWQGKGQECQAGKRNDSID